MEVDDKGGISEPYFGAAVISSRERMDSAGVAAALAGASARFPAPAMENGCRTGADEGALGKIRGLRW